MDLKPRLTCPKCGHTPAIPPYKRIFFLFLRTDAACPGCGTPLENPSWFDDLTIWLAGLSMVASFLLARDRLFALISLFAVLLLMGIVSLWVPLASVLPENDPSGQEEAGKKPFLKKQLTCPKCGQAPVMSSSGKMWLFSFRSKHPCPFCKTPLSNPSWFDFIRMGLFFLGVFVLARRIPSAPLFFLLAAGYFLLTGLISLYFIPLQKHWNTTDYDAQGHPRSD